jgi:hypothetical protein
LAVCTIAMSVEPLEEAEPSNCRQDNFEQGQGIKKV